MIEYRSGNLFKAKKLKWIAHGVNCQGVMASGFAKQLKPYDPINFKVYKEDCDSYKTNEEKERRLLGRYYITLDSLSSSGKNIINLYTQLTYGRNTNTQYANYLSIESCFRRLDYFMGMTFKKKIQTICMPQIGAGLGNAKWEIIEKIINTHSRNYKPIVYILRKKSHGDI